MFRTVEPQFCPECPPTKNKKGKVVGPRLILVEANYSGTGVDMVNCEQCGQGFRVSYKVDKIIRAKDWDVEL
jgi:uncharacterized Zn finger protein